MPTIFDLETISTSINDALRANREGNAARRQEALKTAFQVMQGAQVAAQTRETIQRTSQAGELFPSAKKQAEEGATQAGIETQKKQMSLDEMINLRKFFKEEYGVEVPPEKILSGMQAQTGAEALKVARAGGLAKATGEGILEEERTRKPVATAVAEKAELDTMTSRYQKMFNIPKIAAETLSKTLPQEFGLKLATLEARKAETAVSARKLDIMEGELKYEQEKQKLLAEGLKAAKVSPAEAALWTWAVENGFAPSAEHYVSQIGMLTTALARIETAPSLKAAIEEAAATQEASGITGSTQRGMNAMATLKELWAGTDRPFTTEANKQAARELLRNQINELKTAKSRLPLAQPTKLLTEPESLDPTTKQSLLNERRQARTDRGTR